MVINTWKAKGGESVSEYETLQNQIDELRENIKKLEKEFDEDICGNPLILGACDIDEVADAIKKKLT